LVLLPSDHNIQVTYNKIKGRAAAITTTWCGYAGDNIAASQQYIFPCNQGSGHRHELAMKTAMQETFCLTLIGDASLRDNMQVAYTKIEGPCSSNHNDMVRIWKQQLASHL
jgi:hypothetical protein